MQILSLIEKPWFQYLFVSLFVVVLYANSLSNGYVLDDKIVFTENAFARNGVSGIVDIMRYDSYKGYITENKKALIKPGHYTPLSVVSFAVEEEYWGMNPYRSHLINVGIFWLSSLLMLALCRFLFSKILSPQEASSLALLATLIFIAHPLQTEVVNHIRNRDALMTLFFGLIAAYLLLYSAGKHIVLKLAMIFPISILFFLALLSKETAYAYIAIFPAMLWAFGHTRKRDHVIIILPLLLVAGGYYHYLFSFFALDPNEAIMKNIIYNPFADATSTSEKVATMFFVWLKYFQKLFLPFPLTHDYSFSEVTAKKFADFSVIGSIVLLVGAILLSLTILRKHKAVFAFSLLSILFVFGTVSHWLFPLDRVMAESYIQLAIFPFSIGLAYIFHDLAQRFAGGLNFTQSKPIMYFAAAVLFAYSLLTISRNPDWKDEITIHMADVKTSPNSARLRDALGDLLVIESKKIKNDLNKRKEILNLAIKHLKKSLEIYPEFTSAWVSLGDIYAELGMYKEAREHYQKALKFDNTHAEAHHSLAKICVETDDNRGAIKCFINWVMADPKNTQHFAEAFYGIGNAYEKLDKLDSATFAYSAVILADSTYSDAYNRLGITEGKRKGSMHVSISYFNKAIYFNKRNISAYQNLGEAYAKKGDFNRAIASFERVITLDPKNALAYFEISKVYLQKNNLQKAQVYLNKALELDPSLKSKIKYNGWYTPSRDS